jgi:hypothetical protein
MFVFSHPGELTNFIFGRGEGWAVIWFPDQFGDPDLQKKNRKKVNAEPLAALRGPARHVDEVSIYASLNMSTIQNYLRQTWREISIITYVTPK